MTKLSNSQLSPFLSRDKTIKTVVLPPPFLPDKTTKMAVFVKYYADKTTKKAVFVKYYADKTTKKAVEIPSTADKNSTNSLTYRIYTRKC